MIDFDLDEGETPWDAMSRKELLIEVWKLHWAASRARTVLGMVKRERNDPYWEKGLGFTTLKCLDQALETIEDLSEEDQEVLWKRFFRNALPLLFKNSGWEWMVCEPCKSWTHRGEEITEECAFCGNKDLRPIKWSDFREDLE